MKKIQYLISSKHKKRNLQIFNKFKTQKMKPSNIHWGKTDDRNCNYGHPKMADMKLGKDLFCRLNCFYNVF